MRPIFCGNFEYDARQSDLERLFRRYGKVERVDMKSGFAFIYMENERDADDAIQGLDRTDFGRKGRRLRVEWTKQERGIKRPGSSRRSANTRPSKTLFVINFDPYNTRTRDLERHFEPYGKTLSVRIRRNFAFVQFESQEDANRALDATNMSKLVGRLISVEYAARNDDDRRSGYSSDKGHDRSQERRSYERRRSPSPYRRERGSPDYGRGSSRGPYKKERASPDYGCDRSQSPYRRDKASPDYRRGTSCSPYRRERGGPETSRSPNRRERGSPKNGRGPIRSPYGRERSSPDNGCVLNCSPYGRQRASPENGRGRIHSPYGRKSVSPETGRGPSHSPYGRKSISPENGRGPSHCPYGRKSLSPENGRVTSHSPYGRNSVGPENGCGPSPSIPEPRDSPNYPGAESPMPERYSSRS